MELTRSQHKQEVRSGERFEFGKNWKRFLSVLSDDRIAAAEQTLQRMLEMKRLDGKRFLDVGCGSGLFSLVASRLGGKVHSFDYDPQSIGCARMLKARYAPDAEWVIEEGSVLDKSYLNRLGQFDIVYAWGVLHHTGAMWQAFEHVAPLVREGGILFLAIYNDQGGASRRWRVIKRLYNKSPRFLRPCILLPAMLPYETRAALGQLLRGRNPLRGWFQNGDARGMHRWYDWLDWIGGYPFEVAKPEEVFDFYRKRGFTLVKLVTQGGSLGCNEYVFQKGRPLG
jgi:2-polyprenyl-6-hydroxyphenyl methylase/3-demethylubiquinone-9 3-methyltransferase